MAKRGTEMVNVSVLLVRKLTNSIIIKETEEGEEIILPTSQITWSETGRMGEDGTELIEVELPEWLAADRELI
jgi:hypothetical protein